MTRHDRIIAFDFDGVLCNSIHDSFMTAVNAYLRFTEDPHLPLVNPLTPGEVFQFEKDEPAFFQKFSDLMPLCNRAKDYYVLLHILEEGRTAEITDQAAFDAVKGTIPEARLEAYQDAFYAHRAEMQKNPDAWATLLPPFPGIVEAVQSLSHRFELAVATSKDTASVNILLKRYGLRDLFPGGRILDKDFGKNKRDHLKHLHDALNIPFPDIHFIDDKVSHLQIVKDLNVRPYLAAWGFNAKREWEIARSEGFTLLKKNDLAHLGKDE